MARRKVKTSYLGIFKLAGLVFVGMLTLWFGVWFVTGVNYCSTDDAGVARCYYSPPEKLNMKSLLEIAPIFLGVGSVVPLAVIVLGLKDRFLENKGMSAREITRKGLIWLVSPVMITVLIIAMVGIWNTIYLKEAYGLGLGVGAVFGGGSLWMLFKNKFKVNHQSNYQKSVGIGTTILIIMSLTGGRAVVYGFLGRHSTFTAIFEGMILSAALFAFVALFLLAIVRKEVAQGSEF